MLHEGPRLLLIPGGGGDQPRLTTAGGDALAGGTVSLGVDRQIPLELGRAVVGQRGDWIDAHPHYSLVDEERVGATGRHLLTRGGSDTVLVHQVLHELERLYRARLVQRALGEVLIEEVGAVGADPLAVAAAQTPSEDEAPLRGIAAAALGQALGRV